MELAGEVLFLWGKQMHYYKFNIADYRKDTTHLTPIEHYIYRSLIDWYYLDEHPIPKETQSVIRRLSLGFDMVNLVNNVLADFFDLTEKGYVHNRIEVDILEFHAKAGKNKENGKLGGRPAKPSTAQNKTQPVNFDNPNESEPNLNHKPLTINHKPNNKGSRLSNDWKLPEEYFDYCKQNRPDLNPNFIADEFKDYWISVAGSKGVKADWFATWRNWVRKQRAQPFVNKPSYQDAREAAARTAFGSLLTTQNNLKVINNE